MTMHYCVSDYATAADTVSVIATAIPAATVTDTATAVSPRLKCCLGTLKLMHLHSVVSLACDVGVCSCYWYSQLCIPALHCWQ